MEWIVCVPAFGVDYLTAKRVREAWNDGKDFLMCGPNGGRYINNRDWVKYAPNATIELRYNKRMGFVVIRPEK